MFRKSSGPPMTDTIISNGTVIEGNLDCPSNLRIDGQFNGSITCQGTVTIGEDGVSHANIKANQIIIAGNVCGELSTDGKLTITSTGHLWGNCASQWLVIEEGGTLNGTSKIERPSTLSPTLEALPLPVDNNNEASAADIMNEDESQAIFTQEHTSRYHHNNKKKKRKEKQAG